jgi:r-opsin
MEFLRSNLTKAEARVSPNDMRLLGWNVAPEDLKQIPEHWLSFQEPEASLHYLLALLYIAFTVFALTGNGLVIWVFTAAKSLRSASNVFVVNLAICDFIMMSKTPIFIYNSFSRGFATGILGCKIFGVLGTVSLPHCRHD